MNNVKFNEIPENKTLNILFYRYGDRNNLNFIMPKDNSWMFTHKVTILVNAKIFYNYGPSVHMFVHPSIRSSVLFLTLC